VNHSLTSVKVTPLARAGRNPNRSSACREKTSGTTAVWSADLNVPKNTTSPSNSYARGTATISIDWNCAKNAFACRSNCAVSLACAGSVSFTSAARSFALIAAITALNARSGAEPSAGAVSHHRAAGYARSIRRRHAVVCRGLASAWKITGAWTVRVSCAKAADDPPANPAVTAIPSIAARATLRTAGCTRPPRS
jgi:hypothetical protein